VSLRQLFVEATAVNTLVDREADAPAGRFENWPLSARHQAMRWMSTTFRSWPRSFLEQCMRHQVHSYAVLGHRGRVPYWFDKVVRENLYRPRYAPSPEELASARAAITHSGSPDTAPNQRRWQDRYFENKPYARRLVEWPIPCQMSPLTGPIVDKQRSLVDLRIQLRSTIDGFRRSVVARLIAAVRIREGSWA